MMKWNDQNWEWLYLSDQSGADQSGPYNGWLPILVVPFHYWVSEVIDDPFQ
jgi:hypothetical protein